MNPWCVGPRWPALLLFPTHLHHLLDTFTAARPRTVPLGSLLLRPRIISVSFTVFPRPSLKCSGSQVSLARMTDIVKGADEFHRGGAMPQIADSPLQVLSHAAPSARRLLFFSTCTEPPTSGSLGPGFHVFFPRKHTWGPGVRAGAPVIPGSSLHIPDLVLTTLPSNNGCSKSSS